MPNTIISAIFVQPMATRKPLFCVYVRASVLAHEAHSVAFGRHQLNEMLVPELEPKWICRSRTSLQEPGNGHGAEFEIPFVSGEPLWVVSGKPLID